MVKTRTDKKLECLLVVILLILSGFSIIGLIPVNIGAETDLESQSNVQQPVNSRTGRSIDYDMNLSRTGKHQDMTIYGRRGLTGSETSSPITSLAMGDVTGDGFDDLIIGAAGDNLSLNDNAGLVFVIFGKTPLPTNIDLAITSDLIIQGVDLEDLEGSAVAVGDINGDGIKDIISGAPGADGQANLKPNAGEVHIFYGGSYLKGISIWNQSLMTSNVTIIGNSSSNSEDMLGSSLAVGNFDSDMYDDIIIGAPGGDGIDDQPSSENSGEIWVLYGSNTLSNIIDLESGGAISTSTIFGVDQDDAFGTAIASGDDFNGDGIDDIAVTARFGEGPANAPDSEFGEAYILFCQAVMPKSWDLPVTPANWTIFGASPGDHLGFFSIALGDMNDDNYFDIIVGAPTNDGPIGDRANCGATYVIFGNETNLTNQQWDLGILNANITVYFPNSNDQSGTWVEAFDWNDDAIDDIVISAPIGFGPGNSYPGVGEVAIFNGSQVYQNNQTEIDVLSDSNLIDFYFFGADIIDGFGKIMTYGDLNGDTIIDIAVFADGADGFNNSKNNPGEVYIIRGETSKVPSFKSVKILNADVPIGASCYAKLKPYEFEVNITSPLGITDLTNVTLILDPLGLDLQYMWDRTSGFSELKDPNDYTELDASSNSTNNGNNNWTLGFNIEFDWSCPRLDTPKPVNVILYNAINYYAMTEYNNMFTLENKLNFTGSLSVKGDDSRTLSNNDWVGRGETITWSGLMAVYDGTIDVYPNANDYDVYLWNATKSWLGTSQPGQNFTIQSQTGTQSLASDDYLINITGIPNANDASNVTFNLRLDAENIGYSNHMPTFDDWQNTSIVNCGVTITDTGGGFVNASSIQYRTSFDNGSISGWSNWTSSGVNTDDTSIQVSNDVYFIDGIYNKIQWRGNDTLDNGYELSPTYRIKVDTENITFSKETPKSTELTTTEVEFSITITDEISGVNESTIEYAFTTDDGENWDWKGVNLTGVNNTVKVVVNETFSPGNTNWVKWRASDVAGNVNETEPRQFNISIPTKELWVRLVNPENNTEVPSGSQALEWYTNDNSSNVKFKIYLSKLELFDLSFLQPNATDFAERSYDTEVLENNETYYWTIIPYKGGEVGYCVDGYWSFYVNPEAQKLDHPIVEVINPPNGSEQLTITPTFSWTLKYKKTTGARFDLYLGESPDVLSLYKAGLTKKSYTVPSTDPLDNHVTYYWRVQPHSGPIPASENYMSPIWNFHINTTKVIKETYDFLITTSDSTSITLKQGGSKEITINVVNWKNAETVYMVISGNIASSIFSFTPENLALGKNESKPVKLTITIPKDFKTGDYTFKAVGEMRVSGDVLTKEIAFTLEVKSEDDGGGGGGGDDNTGIFIAIAAIIIIVIILMLLLMMMKRKKKAQAEPEEERMEPEGVEAEGEVPMAAPMAAPIAEPASPLEPAMPTEEVPPEEVLPPTETPEAPASEAAPVAPAAPAAEVPPETPPPAAEAPVAPEAPAEQPPAVEPTPTEPEMPGDLPPDAYEAPPAEPAPAAPAAEAPPAAVPAAPVAPAPTEPAAPEPAQPTEPAQPEATEQPEAKAEEKPKDAENA